MRKYSFFLLALVLLSSCVSKKKYTELSALKEQFEQKYQTELAQRQLKESEADVCNESLTNLKFKAAKLVADTTELGRKYRDKKKNYDILKQSYDMLSNKTSKQLRGKEKEIIELQNNLIAANNKVKDRESELLLIDNDLREQRAEFEKVKAEWMAAQNALSATRKKLSENEERLVELETSLHKQDSLVNALKTKVSAAFLNYKDKGLSVVMKNGKVYVSLDEKLLFATGSTTINAKGEEALSKLSKILEADPDINVMVEGHTDDIPFKAPVNGIKDNWDLSVMRATTVVRIILKHGKIDPVRVIPAGRGPYVPVDDSHTPDARAKNRRIEIILTPKLDELFQILDNK